MLAVNSISPMELILWTNKPRFLLLFSFKILIFLYLLYFVIQQRVLNRSNVGESFASFQKTAREVSCLCTHQELDDMIQATNNSLSYANKSIIEAQEREMAEYLKPVNRSIILLFGTCTGDHYVGMENMKREPHERNFIFCITADYHEHLKFIRLLQKNPETGKYYRLLYGDVDRIPLHLFPKVDIAALLYNKENSDHLDSDTNLIRKILESISPNTEILLPARPRSSEQSYFSFVTDFAKANDSDRNLHLVEKVTIVSSLISLERVINSCSAVVNRAYNDPHVGHIYQVSFQGMTTEIVCKHLVLNNNCRNIARIMTIALDGTRKPQ